MSLRTSCGLLAIFLLSASANEGESLRIYSEHPRLFFRGSPWGDRGLTLETVRRRATRPEAHAVLDKLEQSPPNLALRSLILGDDAAARKAIDLLQEPLRWKEITTDEGIEVGWRAIAYDWLHGHPAFTPERKIRAAENIAQAADRLLNALENGGSHIFHTRMYGWAMGIALAGLALHGDNPQAEDLARYGADYFMTKLFPARRLQDGTVHNGFGYGRKYTMWATAHFISCWFSATGRDLWQEIGDKQGDWARREILFLWYGRYPDKTYLRFGDSYSLLSDDYTFRAISERAWGYGDALATGILRRLIDERGGNVVEKPSAYTYLLFHDPEATGLSPDALPTKALFSRTGTGMVVWKSGWAAGDTTVFFKCGNYFDDHGHFDQGHLDVFRRSMLLLDSGAYLTFDGPFRTEYWHRTVAHNTVLVVDPAVPGDEGGQRVFHSQTDATIGQYLANRKAETGDILDYREAPGTAYVAGDLTAAYPPDRVERVTRELALVDDRYLVVVDRIALRRRELEPRILWHTPAVPRLEEKESRFTVENSGARAVVTTLLPRRPRLQWIGGFVSGGRSIPAVGRLKPATEMGAGRVEVSRPDQGSLNHLFLHVLDIADSTDAAGAVTVSTNAQRIQVKAGSRIVSFNAGSPGLQLK